MARWRLITGIAGVATGVIAAGAGVGLAAEKIAVGRQRMRPDPEAGEPLGELRGRPLTVLAGDGAALHAEIDGPDDAPVTVIFCHGYALNQDIWHYQRRDLADLGQARVLGPARARPVGPGRDQRRTSAGPVSIGQLGEDLYAVLRATSPGRAPVVLVGHSMGGMTIMALAADHPELFGTKVIGTVLISTAATAVDPTGWLPAPVRLAARQAAVPVLRGVARGRPAAMVERLRSSAGDLAFISTRQLRVQRPGDQPGRRGLPRAHDQVHPDRRDRGLLPGPAGAQQAGGAGHRRPGAVRGDHRGPGPADRRTWREARQPASPGPG